MNRTNTSCESHLNTVRDAVLSRSAAGVNSLVNGDLRNATNSFLAALEDSKGLLNQDCSTCTTATTTTCNAEDAMDVGEQSQQQHSFATVEISFGCASTEANMNMYNDSVFTVFNQCLVIPDRDSFDSIIARNEDIVPCILLYNVGLSLHMQGMRVGNEALISRAYFAYDLALNILKGMSAPVAADGLLLLLAVLNNLGAIEGRRFNQDKAAKYGELIRQLLENEDFADMLGDSIFDFFVLYLFISPSMANSAAPAA